MTFQSSSSLTHHHERRISILCLHHPSEKESEERKESFLGSLLSSRVVCIRRGLIHTVGPSIRQWFRRGVGQELGKQ